MRGRRLWDQDRFCEGEDRERLCFALVVDLSEEGRCVGVVVVFL